MRHTKSTWTHIRRSPYQALAAVCIMMLTFVAISTFSFIVFGSSVIIQYFESRPQVTAFFSDDATSTQISQLEQSLKNSGLVTRMHFVSKNEALQIYKQQNQNDPLLLDLVSADILPSSLEISSNNLVNLGPISQILQKESFVQEVVYQKDIISTLTTWTNAIRTIGITLIAVLALVSVFIMMTVIGFKVSQKRDEIEIMRLLSATDWYIRWPFIMEGIVYGIFGTFFGWLIASAGLLYATPYLETFLKGIPLLPVSPVFLMELLLGELLVAILLGMLASSLAVLRYLK